METRLKFAVLSLAVVVFQSMLKLYGALVTRSMSFLSETLDTLTDIGFTSITIYTIVQAAKPPDMEHMFGHEKVEAIGGILQGVILLNLYGFLLVNAIRVILLSGYAVIRPELGIELLVISLSVNLVFSRILIWQGRKTGSVAIKMQGLNLFGDSIRTLFVISSFIFAIFGVFVVDPVLSILISIWICRGAVSAVREGIQDLLDTNPLDPITLMELQEAILQLDHVNGVQDILTRGSGRELFLEITLMVEDHISVVHANEITTAINVIGRRILPSTYSLNFAVTMNPVAGESSLAEKIFNLVQVMAHEHEGIHRVKDINTYEMNEEFFVTLTIVVVPRYTLNEAHAICSRFESELYERAPKIKRITSHIEEDVDSLELEAKNLSRGPLPQGDRVLIESQVVDVLKGETSILGYHWLNFWRVGGELGLEVHLFFDGSSKIAAIHKLLTLVEEKIRQRLAPRPVRTILLHPEPVAGRSEGCLQVTPGKSG
ncbi:MAG: cation diffusion facilitator family transporter [Promethearchaeota archaeon]